MLGGIFIFYALFVSSGHPDKMPRSAVSGLGLRSLPMSNKKDARFIWVKVDAFRLLSAALILCKCNLTLCMP